MELWDAYKADGTLAGFDLVRGGRLWSTNCWKNRTLS